MLNKIRTILIHNSHPGNIGAAARALKNMGLKKLYLVAPKEFPSEIATQRAGRASDILENAIVVDHLKDALIGCRLIYGTSQRERSLAWPVISARHAAKQMMSAYESNNANNPSIENNDKDDIAILYGCEKFGLSNEELHYCQTQIMIDAHPEYASLNLAQAVQIISYELWLASQNNTLDLQNDAHSFQNNAPFLKEAPKIENQSADLANFEELNLFHDHLKETLVKIHFLDPKQPKLLMTRLKRLFDRAQLDKTELNILRGILTAIQKNV